MKNDGIVIMVRLLKLVQHVLCGFRIEKLEKLKHCTGNKTTGSRD